MSEPKGLLLINEQLRRSNRRWKTLALIACAALAFVLLLGFVAVYTAQEQANRELRAANAALAEVHQAPCGGPKGRESGAAEVMKVGVDIPEEATCPLFRFRDNKMNILYNA